MILNRYLVEGCEFPGDSGSCVAEGKSPWQGVPRQSGPSGGNRGPPPGVRPGKGARRWASGGRPWNIWPSQVQLKITTWICHPVGPPPAGIGIVTTTCCSLFGCRDADFWVCPTEEALGQTQNMLERLYISPGSPRRSWREGCLDTSLNPLPLQPNFG